MVGRSRASCPYSFFLGINIGNAVHPTINSILKEEEVCRYETTEPDEPERPKC
uniref:ORF52a n=1 Tax=Pinus koraiensis TaxID=88728 RepID=A4QM28_PINKO|nr:ORF52a [Pinus koraiensis]ABP35355.1 ORF52a [Pinus koraiensis]